MSQFAQLNQSVSTAPVQVAVEVPGVMVKGPVVTGNVVELLVCQLARFPRAAMISGLVPVLGAVFRYCILSA